MRTVLLYFVLWVSVGGGSGAPTGFPVQGLLKSGSLDTAVGPSPVSALPQADQPAKGARKGTKPSRKKSRKRFTKSSSSTSRATLPPGLAEMLKEANSNHAGLKGDILYTARKHCQIHFSLDNYDHVEPTDVVMAQLHVWQIAPKKPIKAPRKKGPSVSHARVSIHEVTQKGRRLTSITRVLDSKLVPANTTGDWVTLDITTAVQGWLRRPSTNKGLELWVESTAPGSRAARLVKKVRFVKPKGRNPKLRPALVMYFKQQKAGF